MSKGKVIMGLHSHRTRNLVARTCPSFEYSLDNAYTLQELGTKLGDYDFCVTDTEFDNPSSDLFTKSRQLYLAMWQEINLGSQALLIIVPDEKAKELGKQQNFPVMARDRVFTGGLQEFFRSITAPIRARSQ
jgi:hypothetical protein